MVTLRIKYTKENYMKFLGHLELMKLFERIFRRHHYPLQFSEGFNPHPRMTFASPLSVGYASKGEVMEVILSQEMPLDSVLNTVFPEGIRVLDAKYVTTKKSLMANILVSEYLIKIEKAHLTESVKELFESFLNQDQILYHKKNKKGVMKEIDAKPQIDEAQLIFHDEDGIVIRCKLQSSSAGNLNPEVFAKSFLSYLKIEGSDVLVLVERIAMFGEDGMPLFELED